MSLKNREYPRAEISRKAETSLIGGSTWVYDTEVKKIFGEIEDGNLIDVVNNRGRYMGTGYYNSHSKIRIRVISQNANDHFDYSFYERRVRYAWEYRKTVMRDDLNCCRVIFGEADGFPGLTVDKFDDILVTQTLSLGTERVKPLILRHLLKSLRKMALIFVEYLREMMLVFAVLKVWKKTKASLSSMDLIFQIQLR